MSDRGEASQAAALILVLDLEEREPDLFVGQTPRTPLQRIFGGQVAGQALMAAAQTLPEDRDVHSMHSYFLRPGDPSEEIRYAVDRLRDGRTFSTRRVVAWQRRKGEDVAIYALTADAARPEPAFTEHSLPMPEVPRPDELPSLQEVVAPYGDKAALALSISRAVEERLLEDPFDPRPKSPPDTTTLTWMRVAGRLPDDQRVHRAALTFVSDLTLLSAGLARLGGGWGGGYVGSSLDHTVWFHQPVAADGTHIATVAQQGLIRSQEQ